MGAKINRIQSTINRTIKKKAPIPTAKLAARVKAIPKNMEKIIINIPPVPAANFSATLASGFILESFGILRMPAIWAEIPVASLTWS